MKKIVLLLLSVFIFNQLTLAQGFDKPQYQIETHRAGVYLGTFNIELFPLIAPLATRNFDSLVSVQAYDSTAFHRVVPGFVIQGGDPNSIHGPVSTWGVGNASQPNVNAEFSPVQHLRGRLGAARDVDTNSATSQFYICVASALGLDGAYTVYGQVTSGMSVVDDIVSSPTVGATERPVQKIEMFITYTGVNDSVPDAPTLTFPANNANGVGTTTNFQWLAITTAVMYTIEFSTDSLFSTISFWRNTGTNSTTMPLIQTSNHYYWRVKANNGGHESVYSNVFSFNSVSAPPVLFVPQDSATNVVLNPVFTWSDISPFSTYTLKVSTNINFTTAGLVYDQSGLTDTMQMVTGLNPFTTYYWRVRSAASQTGVYSPKYSFVTGNTLGLTTPNNFTVNTIYPNPVHHHLTLEASILKPGGLKIYINNSAGEKVYQQNHIATQQKFNTVIDVGRFQKGIYFLTVKMNGEEIVRKVTIN